MKPVSGDTESSLALHTSAAGVSPAVSRDCAGCGHVITDRYLLCVTERYWHQQCLRCSVCGGALCDLGSSCFAKQGMLLCKKDYVRLFGTAGQCAGCRQQIPPHELMIRTRQAVYHPHCLSCSTCQAKLQPGDRYGIVGDALFCERDYAKAAAASQQHVTESANQQSHRQKVS